MSRTHSSPAAHDGDADAKGLAAAEGCAPDWRAEHLEVLAELRTMGMQLARNLTRQVLAQTEAAEAGEVEAPGRRSAPADPGLTFSRISRAVRLTLALEARTHREIEAAASGAAAGAANDDEADDDTVLGPIDYERIREQISGGMRDINDYDIRRAVDDAIEASRDDPDEVERLKEELRERLEEDEVFFDRARWPIGEAVALICQDLGLEPDWRRWETRDWARREAETSPYGSPYAAAPRSPPTQDRRRWSGTETYRQVRGLPPLEGAAAGTEARGPP